MAVIELEDPTIFTHTSLIRFAGVARVELTALLAYARLVRTPGPSAPPRRSGLARLLAVRSRALFPRPAPVTSSPIHRSPRLPDPRNRPWTMRAQARRRTPRGIHEPNRILELQPDSVFMRAGLKNQICAFDIDVSIRTVTSFQ